MQDKKQWHSLIGKGVTTNIRFSKVDKTYRVWALTTQGHLGLVEQEYFDAYPDAWDPPVWVVVGTFKTFSEADACAKQCQRKG